MRTPWFVVRNSPPLSSVFFCKSSILASLFRRSSSPSTRSVVRNNFALLRTAYASFCTYFSRRHYPLLVSLNWQPLVNLDASGQSGFLCPRFLGSCCFDGRMNVLLFFRRWQHSGHSQRFDPEFARPSARVVEMFIFFGLDLIMCLL